MSVDVEVHWHAWADGDEPDRATTYYSTVDCETQPDGIELAQSVVWQQAVNNYDNDEMWKDGEIIVEIVKPQQVAGLYRIEIQTLVRTTGHTWEPEASEAACDVR